MKRPQKTMDDTTFNQIVYKLKKEKIKPTVFILNGFGEPLIDPNLISRINTIKGQFPNSKVKLYSNLNLANSKIIKKLIKSNLDEINISLNGYNQKSYQQVMKINYQKTIKNLNNLISTKKKLNSPLIIRISMTLVKANENFSTSFIKKWSPLVDSVSVNKVHNYNGNVKKLNNKYKINYNKTAFPCRYLWDTITFDVNGQIVLCCLDYESQYSFGNINQCSILKTYYSPKFQSIRKQHLKFQSKNITICKSCYTPYKNGVEWLVKKLY
jgi:radical SAM protein with 4Fe4S-binding SPASM domain